MLLASSSKLPPAIPRRTPILATLAAIFWSNAVFSGLSHGQESGDQPSVASVLELAGAINETVDRTIAETAADAGSQTTRKPMLWHTVVMTRDSSEVQAKPAAPAKKPSAKKPPVKKSPATPKGKPGNKSHEKEELAEFKDAPDNVCNACIGTGHVPLPVGTRPYWRIESDPAAAAADAVPWKFCPKCSYGRNAEELVEVETLRLRAADDSHIAWEKRTGLKLVRGETRHLALHAECTPEAMRKQLKAADALATLLQSRTKSVFLTPTRPGTLEMLTVVDRSKYLKLIDICRSVDEFKAIPDWGLLPHVTGFSGYVTTVNFIPPGNPAPPANVVISAMAVREISITTEGKANAWLRCGFAYFCEHALTGKIQVQYVDYKPDEVKLGPDWIAETRRHAAAGNLRVWDDLFYLSLNEFTAVDHLTSFASVAYLFNTDPQKFCVFCLAIKRGEKAEVAAPRIYGESLKKLQANCVRAVLGR